MALSSINREYRLKHPGGQASIVRRWLAGETTFDIGVSFGLGGAHLNNAQAWPIQRAIVSFIEKYAGVHDVQQYSDEYIRVCAGKALRNWSSQP